MFAADFTFTGPPAFTAAPSPIWALTFCSATVAPRNTPDRPDSCFAAASVVRSPRALANTPFPAVSVPFTSTVALFRITPTAAANGSSLLATLLPALADASMLLPASRPMFPAAFITAPFSTLTAAFSTATFTAMGMASSPLPAVMSALSFALTLIEPPPEGLAAPSAP